jgi:predicted nucleic acid-binding protein
VKYVLDASVAVRWLLAEPGFEKAEQLVLNARNGLDELIAPDFFLAECGHALFRAERKNNIAAGEARRLLTILIHDLPDLHPSHELVPRAAAICQHLRKSFYDCLYMALAEREQIQFITADTKLVTAAQPDYPYVVDLAELP